MIIQILFNLVTFFNKPNKHVISESTFTDGAVEWEYKYGSKVYRSVGKPPEEPPMGLFFTVQRAMAGGLDVTEEFKAYAGPKCNHVPDTGYILHRLVPRFRVSFPGRIRIELGLQKQKGESVEIRATNLIGQMSVFGAR